MHSWETLASALHAEMGRGGGGWVGGWVVGGLTQQRNVVRAPGQDTNC